ncbi:MAG: nitroreductase family protein [Treponema sp.]
MNINDYEILMKERQSCRYFDGTKSVEKSDLIKILELAKLSPSACNSQPYSVFISLGDSVAKIKDTKVMGFNSFIDECTAFFVITEARYSLPAKIGSLMQGIDFRAIDIGIFTANLVNASRILGIETCILGVFNEEKIQKIIGSNDRVKLVIALGYPAQKYTIKEKTRKPFEENIHFI